MRVALNVYDALMAWKRRPADSKKLIEWMKAHRAEKEIVDYVEELRRGG